MPMTQSKFIFVGIKGSVIALNSATGEKIWERSLKGSSFTNVILDGNNLLAAAQGEVFCLDPGTGIIRWHNPLKGYGWGIATIAGAGMAQNFAAVEAEKRRRDQDAASSSSAS
jgi:outer membrane protein assembly factor BamB